MKLNRRKCCFLVAFLLSGLALGLGVEAPPSRALSGPLVNVQSTRTVDGDPSDWAGTLGADNTWVVSSGEGIWRDIAFDDTGNGSYIYLNGTHRDIPDSAVPGGKALYYTDKYGGPDVEPFWHKHGGMVDLREFRVTADSSNLYMLLRFENMGSFLIATYWDRPPIGIPEWRGLGFGKILAQIFIDKDRIPGSGRTDSSMNDPTGNASGNFLLDSSAAWEVNIMLAGNIERGFPKVELADGTTYYINSSNYCYGDCDIYPSAIELKVPFSMIGDARGKTWRFIVVVGGYEAGLWRQVWSTTLAKEMGWPPMFRFVGGEGEDWPGGMGNDPNIIDMAFTSSQAEQEALLNEFQTTGQIVEIDAYQDIYFDASGNVSLLPVGGFIIPANKLELLVPWIGIGSVGLITITTVVIRKRER